MNNFSSGHFKHQTANDKGFTLVELLVVISITALLMGVLIPCLAKSRSQARQLVCSSNIRQLFIANCGYSTENDDFYVIAANDICGKNLHRWHGVRDNLNEEFDPLRGPLVGYLQDGKIKRCPDFRKDKEFFSQAGQTGGNFEAGCGGYGYNDQYIGGRYDLYGMLEGPKSSAQSMAVKKPGQTVMFTDSAYYQSTNEGNAYIEYSFCHPPFWQWYIEFINSLPTGISVSGIDGRPDPTIHFRHKGFTTVSWVDGHVSKETMDLSAAYITHAVMPQEQTAEKALGWFGPDNNNFFDLK